MKCSLLENILFDYSKGNLPLDPIEWFTDGMNWKEQTSFVLWWNKAQKEGSGSVAHLKLCYVVQDIIKSNVNNCEFIHLPIGKWNI